MIYFDNSATTLRKPAEVGEAVAYAIANFGNPGRSFYDAVMHANREIYRTRAEIAKLIGLEDPLKVAFTYSATESFNLVINSLVKKEDTVITTTTEHNSVLRPLYLKECDIVFMDCDDEGNILIDTFEELINPSTKFLICTHGSNVTGNVTDAEKLYRLCKKNNIMMILDVSQTFGAYPVNLGMADIFCFTGHKSLFGPQGTGGIIVNGDFDFKIVKTGGTGVNSFEKLQPKTMPDVFEAGTLNCPGLYGLQKGASFINSMGVDKIHKKEENLARIFYNGIKEIENVEIYGNFKTRNRLAVVSIKVEGISASDFSAELWNKYSIATRPGSHCAPLLHKHFNTVESGLVRFSFSYFNTEEEIKMGISAVKNIVESTGQ